jgi:hypothetical protein
MALCLPSDGNGVPAVDSARTETATDDVGHGLAIGDQLPSLAELADDLLWAMGFLRVESPHITRTDLGCRPLRACVVGIRTPCRAFQAECTQSNAAQITPMLVLDEAWQIQRTPFRNPVISLGHNERARDPAVHSLPVGLARRLLGMLRVTGVDAPVHPNAGER